MKGDGDRWMDGDCRGKRADQPRNEERVDKVVWLGLERERDDKLD